MSVPIITFFNGNSRVGQTSLVYHLTWMFSRIGHRVLVCDLDPQAKLTAAFLDEQNLESIWSRSSNQIGHTIYQGIQPLTEGREIKPVELVRIAPQSYLIPGDLLLTRLENSLSRNWLSLMESANPYRSLHFLTAFSTVIQNGYSEVDASIVFVNCGPIQCSINRSAMIITGYLITPLGSGIRSLHGLRVGGSCINEWRSEWLQLRSALKTESSNISHGIMRPIGYIIRQPRVRLTRPMATQYQWVNQMPEQYAKILLNQQQSGPVPVTPSEDPNCLGAVKTYPSLTRMAQEARKPTFLLTYADGAVGGHAAAVADAYSEFRTLANRIWSRVDRLQGAARSD